MENAPDIKSKSEKSFLSEFLSHMLFCFENLNNHQMILFIEHYFINKNPKGIEQFVSTRNISNWRTNEAPNLDEISRLIKKQL